MNRPACIKHIDQHVARARVTPYRLRSTDAQRLLDYLEHLERSPGGVKAGPDMGLIAERLGVGGEPCGQCGTVGGHLVGCEA
jgi:hypothetical protein